MKRLTAIMMSLLLILTITACGGSTKSAAGMYTCTGSEVNGVSLTAEETFDGATTLDLKDDGAGTINIADTSTPLTWTLKGSAVTLEFNDTTSKGTLKDGVIVLDLYGSGTNATFVKDGTDTGNTENPTK